MVEDVLLHDRADGRLLDAYEKMAPSLETEQLCPRNGGSRELGIVKELQGVVGGMEDQGRSLDRGNSFIRHLRLVVERHTVGARRNRVHIIYNLVNQLALFGGQTGNDRVAGAHQFHELPLEQLADSPVQRIIGVDCRQHIAFLFAWA